MKKSIAEYRINNSLSKGVFIYQYNFVIIHKLYNLSLQFFYTHYVYLFFLLVLTLHILKKLKAFDATVGILLLKNTLTNHTIHMCPFSESKRHVDSCFTRCHLFMLSSQSPWVSVILTQFTNSPTPRNSLDQKVNLTVTFPAHNMDGSNQMNE